MTVAPPEARPGGRRRRRVWPFVVLGLVIVLVIAAVVADAAAKSYAEAEIKRQLVSALGVDPSTEVTVDLGGGSFLLQALRGRLDTVDVSVPELRFGTLVGSASVHATGVPVDTSKPVQTLTVTYRVGEKDLSALAANLSSVDLDSITVKKPDLVANATIVVLGARIPVALGVAPSVMDGQLAFTPTTISAGGTTFTAEQLRSSPVFGRLASSLLKQQSFCVAQYLPKALTASAVAVTDTGVVIRFTGDGAVLGGSGFTTKGTCP